MKYDDIRIRSKIIVAVGTFFLLACLGVSFLLYKLRLVRESKELFTQMVNVNTQFGQTLTTFAY